MEIWRDIPGFEGYYQASNYGRVRSVDRVTRAKDNGTRITRGRMCNHKITPAGHHVVPLSVEGKSQWLPVHVLVYLSFKGPRPDGCVVHHIDENKDNNRVDNLVTMSISAHVSFHNSGGKSKVRGERNSHNILSEYQVLEIVELLNNSAMTQEDIAAQYGVAGKTINCINTGASWNWLTGRKPIPAHERNSRSLKLSDADVVDVRESVSLGVRKTDLAERYGVSASQIYRIANKQSR